MSLLGESGNGKVTLIVTVQTPVPQGTSLMRLGFSERWEALTPEQRRKFPPIAPDFCH